MWIKLLRQRKLQTVMMFFIIAVCTTLLAGAISILSSLKKPSEDFIKASNCETAKVYPFFEDDDKVFQMGRQFEKLSNVKKVLYVREYYIIENMYLNGKKEDFFADLTEYNKKKDESAIYVEGSPDAGKNLADDECILPVCISNKYHMHTGDTVKVKLEARDVIYKVAAVYTDPYQTSTAFDCDILINKLPEGVEGSLIIAVYGKNNATGSQIEQEYREKNNGLMNAVLYSAADRMDNGLVVAKILGALFLSVGIIMLLVSGLMVHFMIKNAMITDTKSIAILKSMGYISNDILFLYLKLYFSIVTLACLAGNAGSVIFSNMVIKSTFQNMGRMRANNSFLSGVICYAAIVSFVILIVTINIMKTRRIKPIHSLRGEDYGGIKKQKHYKGNLSVQFSPIGIAYRTFMREKRSAVKIIITCMVTIFSANFIIISYDVALTLKKNNDFWLGVDKTDAVITVADTKDYSRIKALAETDDRVKYCIHRIDQARTSLKWKKGMAITVMYANVYDNYIKAKLPVTEGRNPRAYNEIALSTTMAKSLHKEIGDYIEVYLYGEHKADLLITGLYQTYMQFGRMCRLTTDALKKHNCTYQYNCISIHLKNSKDTDKFIMDMKKQIGSSGNIIKGTEQFASVMDMIAEPQQQAIPPVLVLILLIAGMNIFSIVYLKNMKSQKINSIYKCIGYTTGHLILSNVCYVAAIALFCVIVTLPVSLVTYEPIMKSSLSMFNFTKYPMQINRLHLFISNAVVIAVFIISTLASSKALYRVNARDLVKE